jgi:hypothetical protein
LFEGLTMRWWIGEVDEDDLRQAEFGDARLRYSIIPIAAADWIVAALLVAGEALLWLTLAWIATERLLC